MRNGLLISFSAHAALIIFAVADGIIASEPETPDEEIILSSVDILSEAEFQATFSTAPDFVPTDTIALGVPEELVQEADASDEEALVEVTDIDGPDDPSARDGDPDLSAVRNVVRVETTQETAELTSVLPQAPVLGIQRPTAPNARPTRPTPARPTMGRPTPPRPSLNIDTTPSAPPPEETETAREEQTEVAEATEQAEEAPAETAQDETAREEAATDIIPQIAEDVTDAGEETDLAQIDEEAEEPAVPIVSETDDPDLIDPDQQISGAPARSELPPARPAPAEEVQLAENTERATEAGDPNLDSNGFPIGSPISAGERQGLVDAIGQYWNLSILDGLPNSDELTVTVGVTLNQDGTILNGEVRPIEPADPQGPYLRAFQAAQRAVLQAGFRGDIDMPPEKYARWREVEITFNPGTQQIGF
ncbi:MAG: hypothetical protein AAFQ36_08080 [Pseudomonadota bacterium]